MRIISGKFRSRSLAASSSSKIRPTSDRIRESLFNILEHRFLEDFSGLRVLDLFAGTGALGLEALSRGAENIVFIEKSYEGYVLLRKNVEVLGLTKVSSVFRRDATQPGVIKTLPFNLVFADPPYAQGLGEKAFSALLNGGWLCNDALLILEETAHVSIRLPKRFIINEERYYGSIAIRFYILS